MGPTGDPPDPELLTGTVSLPEHAVYRAFPAETVVLNLDTGQYYGLNPTGGRMLEVLVEVGHFATAVDRLSADFGRPRDQIERDLCALCAGLKERGLISVGPASRG